MKKAVYYYLFFIFLSSCITNDKTNQDTSIDSLANEKKATEENLNGIDSVNTNGINENSDEDLKVRMLGAWTDGTSENATFDIKENSIFYVDQGEEYKYTFEKKEIRIKFPDYTYTAQVSFNTDTLVPNSSEYGQSKFWRFEP